MEEGRFGGGIFILAEEDSSLALALAVALNIFYN